MKIIIKTRNLELTPSLEKFINDKIGKLEKFFPPKADPPSADKAGGSKVFVEIEKETLHHKKGEVFFAEAILQLPGKKLVARAKGSDLQNIIIEVKDEMEIGMKKYKMKKVQEPRRKIQKLQY